MEFDADKVLLEAIQKVSPKLIDLWQEQDAKFTREVSDNILRGLFCSESSVSHLFEGSVYTRGSELLIQLRNGKQLIIQIGVLRDEEGRS